MYVVIEGGEGAGKTRLTKWLVEQILVEQLSSSKGFPVRAIREPPDSSLGKVAIDYFRGKFVEPRVAAYLMTAARIDLHQWIEATGGFDGGPSGFDDGLWICDRSFLSTFVYQAEVGLTTLLQMHGWGSRAGETYPVQIPDLLIYLDVHPEEAVRRVRERGSEHLSDDQVRRFAERYRGIVDLFRQRWNSASDGPGRKIVVSIDANQSFEIVAEEARKQIYQRMEFLSLSGGSE